MASKVRTTGSTEALLSDLARFARGGAGEADSRHLLRTHLPIAEHRRVLDRDTLLVLGGRGAGKTQLFSVLNVLSNPADLAGLATHGPGLTSRHSSFVAGFTVSRKEFPPHDVLEKARIENRLGTPEHFWLGLLVGVLLRDEKIKHSLLSQLDQSLVHDFSEKLALPSLWLPTVGSELEKLRHAIDHADSFLESNSRELTIAYDDLDLLAARLSNAYPLIRALLAFWLHGSRRWRAIRCKIFLRTDIFAAEELAFTDSSKLRPLSVTLRWSAENLYRLVLKRLLNGEASEQWQGFIQRKIPKTKLRHEAPWGMLPITDEKAHRDLMELLIGQYMGADKRRGDTYQWFLNHLQDSRGDIAPRSFLKLFESAAQKQQNNPLQNSEKLLAPEQVNAALAEVSQDRITELREEFRWIDSFQRDIKGVTVPIERAEFRKLLKNIEQEHFPEYVRSSKDAIIDYLIGLGILRETNDARIHVPDIYLFGFGLRRKGGIRRPAA